MPLLMSAEGLLSGFGGLPGSLQAFSGACPGTLQPFLQPGIGRHPEQSIPAPGAAAHSYLPPCWADDSATTAGPHVVVSSVAAELLAPGLLHQVPPGDITLCLLE